MLLIPCGVFYDDFPMFSPSELAEDADSSASAVLEILGWRHAWTGPQGKPFSEVFQVLGCQLDLRQLGQGKITLQNKQGRIERIFSQLGCIRNQNHMTLYQSQVEIFLWLLCGATSSTAVYGITSAWEPGDLKGFAHTLRLRLDPASPFFLCEW